MQTGDMPKIKKRGGQKSPLTPKQRKIAATARAVRRAAERDADPTIAEREAWLARKVEALAQARTQQWPQTLDDIAGRSGPYADTVVAVAKARAACLWATPWQQPAPALTNSREVISQCFDLYRAQLWRDVGGWGPHGEYVIHDSGDVEKLPAPVLDDLSEDSRCEAMRVIAETQAEWEAAGCPGLDHSNLHFAFRSLEIEIADGRLAPIPE